MLIFEPGQRLIVN